jgi:two-component system CitB family sensor kinase
VRAVVPIYRDDELVGMVSAGVTTASLGTEVLPRVPFLVGLSIIVVALGSVAAALTRRSLGRLTGRLAPSAMASMVRFYESVLHSVREGVVLTDSRRRVVLYNDEAADLLGLPPAQTSAEPRTPAELGIAPDVADLLLSGRRVVEETHFADGRVLLVNQETAGEPGRVASGSQGAVMTLRDQSRLQSLLGELESVRTMSEAMKSQSHEHANLLHTVAALLEIGRTDEAMALLVSSSHASQELADALQEGAGDPVLVALLLGKSATAGERGIRLDVDIDESVPLPFSRHELVSVVGNLLDNALDAAFLGDPPRTVGIRMHEGAAGIEIAVADSGPGLPAGVDVFAPGVTTKADDAGAHGLGLVLVRQIVEGHGGTIRFDESPTTAVVTIPRSGG